MHLTTSNMESQSYITTISADKKSHGKIFRTRKGLYQHLRSFMGIKREPPDKEDLVNLEQRSSCKRKVGMRGPSENRDPFK